MGGSPPAVAFPPFNMINEFNIKFALLCYYRFKRQWICVDECMKADIIADSGNHIIEVEIKTGKYDLFKEGTCKRFKHDSYMKLLHSERHLWNRYVPNKYYFCVPSIIKDEAIEYATSLNKRYGVIVFYEETFKRSLEQFNRLRMTNISIFGDSILTVKSAQNLHNDYSKAYQNQIAKRASCKLITMMHKELKDDSA